MTRYIALLRAVNVGGTGKLPMAELKTLCTDAGFTGVETYIASGNVVLTSATTADAVKAKLEKALHAYAKKPVGVVVRTAAELSDILKQHPFRKDQPNLTYVIFLDDKPPRDALDKATGPADEKMQLGKREIFVSYPNGMGRSKLKIPAAKTGTARNLNTVAALLAMASKTSAS
jgi:uncharacterized protein (DUF1697 family)